MRLSFLVAKWYTLYQVINFLALHSDECVVQFFAFNANNIVTFYFTLLMPACVLKDFPMSASGIAI